MEKDGKVTIGESVSFSRTAVLCDDVPMET
jgi:hypothetical protein